MQDAQEGGRKAAGSEEAMLRLFSPTLNRHLLRPNKEPHSAASIAGIFYVSC